MSTPDAAPRDEARATSSTDEVSLRELYLVLRRRSGWIVAAAILAAAAAFAFLSTRPAIYVAEATTVVARPPIEVDLGTNLRFRPEISVTFDTYATLAHSRGVLEAVLPHHEAETLSRLENSLELERVAGTANQPSTFLAVVHEVSSRDPESAAASAGAWVEATVAHVRALMLENLDAVELITGDSVALTRARVHDAETALEGYRAEAAPEALRSRQDAMDERFVELESIALELQRTLEGRLAERSALLAARESGDPTGGVVLMDAPEVVVELDGALVSLDARVESLRSERERVLEQLSELRVERGAVAAELADATVRLAALERAAREARQALEVLAAIDPNVAYVAQLAPSGVRVLSEAGVPTEAEPRRALLVALLVAVVTGFAGMVLALLSEAVRAPNGEARPERASS